MKIVTFTIGGPLHGYYLRLRVDPEENDGPDSEESVIRKFCSQNFQKNWVTTYDPKEFEPQIAKFGLRLLAAGRIEVYEGRYYFHPEDQPR